nr:small glutamine-rich tetratricopeptide repeat-containing protein [Tanacetum cinerariifolium]
MSIPHNNHGPPPTGPPPQNNNGPPSVVRTNGPVPNLRSIEELCQPSINGRGRPIAPILIQDADFGLRQHMIQQVQDSCQFYGLPGDDANRHIDKFLEVTQHMKQNGVSYDSLRLSFFPYSLTHHATSCSKTFSPLSSQSQSHLDVVAVAVEKVDEIEEQFVSQVHIQRRTNVIQYHMVILSFTVSGKSDRDQSDKDLVKVTGVSEDEIYGQFLSALEKVQYFGTADSGDDEHALKRAKNLFHSTFAAMEKYGCKEINLTSLADTFKLHGNKLYPEAIELYTVAIALHEQLLIPILARMQKQSLTTRKQLQSTQSTSRPTVAVEHKVWQQREERGHIFSLIDSDPVQEKQKSTVASVKEHDEARIDLRFKKMKKKMSKS